MTFFCALNRRQVCDFWVKAVCDLHAEHTLCFVFGKDTNSSNKMSISDKLGMRTAGSLNRIAGAVCEAPVGYGEVWGLKTSLHGQKKSITAS